MSMIELVMVFGLALVLKGGQCQLREVLVAEGSIAVLPCVDESSSVSYAVHWSKIVGNSQKTVWRRGKNGLEFRPVRDIPRAFGKSDYSLHIHGTTPADGGQYVCEVDGKTKTVMLRVLRASIYPAVVFEGSTMELKCDVSPMTLNSLSITRKLNDKVINSLSVLNVSQRHAGKWTCKLSYNNVVVEATTSLQVKGISTPQDDSSVFYATFGSSFSLPCVFTDGLIPNSVTWKRTSTNTHSPVHHGKSFNLSSGLIQRVEDGDEGMYTCSGMMEGMNNTKIKVQRTMKLVVARVLSSSSSNPVTLTCSLSNYHQITAYEWLHVNYGPNDTQTLTTIQKTKSSRIQLTKEEANGEWMCRYFTNEGLMGNVTHNFYMTGAMKSEKSSSGNKTAMVMGLGFLFLVIFLILFQMYRNYQRKKKIHLYPAMETIVHQAATDREWRERSEGKRTEACVGEPRLVCV